jgi:cation:H+ antiporter
MEYIALFLGLFFLIKGGEYLFEGSLAVSMKLNIPRFIIGMTVVSFATSAPELVVSVQSAIMGYPDLALGNIVGSNIANVAFVLGIVVLLSPVKIEKVFYKFDWPVMMVVSLLFYFLLQSGNALTRMEGAVLIIALIIYLFVILFFQKSRLVEDEVFEEQATTKYTQIVYLILFGGFLLWLGSEVLIKGAVSLASKLGVSERIISVSIIAFGTSIPELSTSIIAIMNKEHKISIGNLIGSNIFDMLGIIGITGLLSPIYISDKALISSDLIWMLSVAFLILPLVFFPNKMKFGRAEGVILILVYVLFIGRLF